MPCRSLMMSLGVAASLHAWSACSGEAEDAADSADDDGVACPAVDQPHAGEATYYAADGTGNCSFPASPDELLVAAMNDDDYDLATWCGACLAVSGPDGDVVVRVVDRCPGCAAGDLDLSPQAFERIALLAEGRVAITWHEVACDVTGPVRYHWKVGSNPFWTAVQVRNHRHRIARVEGRGASGAAATWRDLVRATDNYFVGEGGLGDGPYALRITDDRGLVVEAADLPFAADTEVTGATQFEQCSP